jgi:hypothetical protein
MEIRSIAPMAIPYNEYRYLWSPRPAHIIKPDKLEDYENSQWLAQPKLNGSNTLVFMHSDGTAIVKNRHGQDKTGQIKIDFAKLYRGEGWFVLNGEWMEKSKKDEGGNNFNGNFVIFDVLAYNGHILAGSTVVNRLHLLHDLYGHSFMSVVENKLVTSEPYLYLTGIDNVYRVVTYTNKFKLLFNMLTKIDMYEGLVVKHIGFHLLPPFTQIANDKSMFKSRKETKIYKY